MAPESAFLTVAILIIFVMITAVLMFKFRYVIRTGYFRAEIITESGQYISKTMRLRNSRQFTIMVEGTMDTYHILDGREETIDVKGKPQTFKHPNRVYHGGKMRIPKSYYNAHQSEPIDMQNLRKESKVSATRYSELARNTVTTGLLDAFRETSMREAMEKLMLVLIPLAGLLILGYFMNTRIEQVLDRLP